MTTFPILRLTLLLGFAPILQAQTSDFPGASDFKAINRPADSFIVGAMHIDNDEYAIPVGPVERNASQLGKTVAATGPIDTLVYSGPTTASSLTTFSNVAAQLTTLGFEPVWACSRATCGSAFALMQMLSRPVLDSIHGDWGHAIINSLYAANDDSRYGSFRRGDEYVIVLASLSPGNRSGALLIRINGHGQSVVQTATTPNPHETAPGPGPQSTTGDSSSAPRTRVRAARSIDP